jgi:hypothetical protein
MTTSGMLLALAYWSLMLTVLVFLGITVSVMFTNTLLGVTVLGVFWYLGLMLLAAAYAGDLTVDGVLGGLPLVLQGQSRMVEISTILIIGGIPLPSMEASNPVLTQVHHIIYPTRDSPLYGHR